MGILRQSDLLHCRGFGRARLDGAVDGGAQLNQHLAKARNLGKRGRWPVSGDDHRDIERQHATERGDQAVEIAIAQIAAGMGCSRRGDLCAGSRLGRPAIPAARGGKWSAVQVSGPQPFRRRKRRRRRLKGNPLP